MPTVTLADLDLHYELRGDGPRLLLFNGSGGTIEGSAPLVDQLAKHFEVAVHDQRCLGRTGLPQTRDTPTMADYAADGAALLDHLGWPTALVFGISFGGMVAQEFAVTWPARVERLALLCTSAGGSGGSSYPLHALADLPPDERAAVSLRNLDTRFDAAWLADHPADQAIVTLMAERARAPKTAEVMSGEALQLAARAYHDVWDRLYRITSPTIVACGEFDGLAPPSNSEAIATRIEGSRLERYQGGHLFVYQDRRALPDVVDFLLGNR
jgi:pimeloyl-ACP methyl ester carboxylesterase